MAAVPKARRPELLSKLEGHTGTVNRAVIIKGEDAIVTVSEDKYVSLFRKVGMGNLGWVTWDGGDASKQRR